MGDLKRLIVIVFAISLVAVGFAAGQSYLAGLYRRQAEMGYRRALTEFATHIQALSSELNRARVARGTEQRGLIGSTVRRLVYAAQGNLGELPLGTVQLERVERLLGHIAAETYAYQDGEERLPGFYQQIEYVSHELQALLREKTKEPALAARAVFPPTWAALAAINDGLEELKLPQRSGEISGAEISREEAVAAAAAFSPIEGLRFIVTNESKGAIPAYTVEGKDEGQHLILEVSRRGGLVLWMTAVQEQSGQNRLSLGEMAELGQAFLAERGFPSVQVTDAQVLQNRALFTYVPKREGILRYAEPIRVQVSGDSGAIVGFWAAAYHLAQSRPGPEKPAETIQEAPWSAAEKVRAGAEILDQKRALIHDRQEREILVERLGVRYQEQYYLIYLNARSGEEERIVPVTSPQFF